ncbi:MFS transporter [Halobaculum sp. WSA2]|uniref:MFS transporter n=1 Tax=Halobaculum saliterrae TaxID=2073113 RepID=A0A6B0SSB6_9EURY|nr:MFS transporter [Halobaculum saliterrae]MXR41545.1 MFS transporter [Halobaculum saliterrae]
MSRGRLFGTLCGTVFLVNMARVVFAPLLSEFIDTFGIGEATAGLLVTLVWIGSAAPRLPTGWLLTRVPRHHVVLGAGVVLTLASTFAAFAPGVDVLMIAAVGMGLASGVYFIAGNPLVSELFPETVGRVMGIHGTASQLAAVTAAPFATVALGLGIEAFAGWRAVFAVLAVAAATVTAAVFVAARAADLPDAGAGDRDLLGAARSEWRTVLTGVLILGIAGFVWQGVFNFYELYMLDKGLAPNVARNALTVVFGAGVPAFLISGRLADRFPHVPYLLSVLAAFIVCLFALVSVSGLVPLLVVSAVIGYVIHSLFPAMDTYLLDTLPDATRGSAYAVYSASMMIVQATGSSVVGSLRGAGFAYDAVFGAAAVGLVVLLVGLVFAQRASWLPE